MSFDKIKVDFTKSGLDNVKELLVDAGYPRSELEKLQVYTNQKSDEQGSTELFVGVADADLAGRITNEGVEASTVPNAANDESAEKKATFTKILKHNYKRIDPLASRGMRKLTDSFSEGGRFLPEAADVNELAKKLLAYVPGKQDTMDAQIEGVTLALEGEEGTLKYGLNKFNYSFGENDLCFTKTNAENKLVLRVRADTTRGDQVVIFPKLVTPHALVDGFTPIAAFETKAADLNPTDRLSNIFLSDKTAKDYGNQKPNQVFGVSIDLANVTDMDKLKETYFSKAYSDHAGRLAEAKKLTFKEAEVVTQADEFGSELITNAAQLVKYETNADLNDDNTTVEANVGFYVVPLSAKTIGNDFLTSGSEGREEWSVRETSPTNLGGADDYTLYHEMADRGTDYPQVGNPDTEEGREAIKAAMQRLIQTNYVKDNPAFKVELQNADEGGVVYDKDSFTFKVSAASGYENFIKGAVYVVADFTVGKFRVAEDLDGFGEVQL